MRLTNMLRISITNQLIKKSGVRDRIKKADDIFTEKLIETYINQWSEHKEAMSKLPDGFFDTTSQARFSFRGGHFNRDMKSVDIPECYTGWNHNSLKLDKFPKLLKLYKKIEKTKGEESEIRDEARRVLSSVTTVKRLIEAWPEVECLIPQASKPTALMPIESINNLNKLIPLGVE